MFPRERREEDKSWSVIEEMMSTTNRGRKDGKQLSPPPVSSLSGS